MKPLTMDEKEEYHKCMQYLIPNLKSSGVITRVIRDLAEWQERIIEDLVK